MLAPMFARAIAERIVRLRKLMIIGNVAELAGDAEKAQWALGNFEREADRLPITIKMRGGLARRVLAPVDRMRDRVGILNLALRVKLDEAER